MSIFEIGINDTLQDVIRKANYNFRQISNSRMSAIGSGGTDADISGLIEDLEEEVRNRISADEQINDTIDGMFDQSGKLSSSIMPSYVDDVIEAYPRSGAAELSSDWLSLTSGGSALEPETGKIYILLSNSTNYQANAMFRWTGSTYVELSGNGASSDVYPTFIIPTWSESSDPTTLPVTPCFVLNSTNSAYYYCNSTTITRINPEYQTKGSYISYTDYSQTNRNLNNLTTNGVYSVYNPTNTPVANQWLIVFVFRYNNNGNYVLQIAFPIDQSRVYKRRSSGGTFGAWTSVTFT